MNTAIERDTNIDANEIVESSTRHLSRKFAGSTMRLIFAQSLSSRIKVLRAQKYKHSWLSLQRVSLRIA
ncbi:MAG: hypothetical protein NT119_03095 [Actinobacteria bacterium]|nr:hypothetical protein [Actinomycetota bacterium]